MHISFLNITNLINNVRLEKFIYKIDKRIALIATCLFITLGLSLAYIYSRWKSWKVNQLEKKDEERIPELKENSEGEKIITDKIFQEANKTNAVWIIIENKVYDITKFIDEHPGGRDVLMDCKGKDATQIFNQIGHTMSAQLLMKDYSIGIYQEPKVDRKNNVEAEDPLPKVEKHVELQAPPLQHDDSLSDLAKKYSKDLIRGVKRPQDVIEEFSSDQNKKKNKKFLYQLAENLGDPVIDYCSLVKAAQKDWQIKALSKGVAENHLARSWVKTEERFKEFFVDFRKHHANHPEFEQALKKSETHILAKLHDMQVKQQEIESQITDPYIDITQNNLLVDSRVLPAKQSLSWEDLLDLLYSGIALRHTSSMDRSEKELINGTNGDALCISEGIASLVYHLFKDKIGNVSFLKEMGHYLEPTEVETIENLEKNGDYLAIYYWIFKHFRKIESKFSEEEKKIILRKYEEALRQFIYDSTFLFNNRLPKKAKDWKVRWEENLSKSTNFIIVKKDQNDLRPYDQMSYYNLGKLGRGSIQNEELKEIIPPPTEVEIQTFQKDTQDITLQMIAIQEKSVDRFLRLILAAAKRQITFKSPHSLKRDNF